MSRRSGNLEMLREPRLLTLLFFFSIASAIDTLTPSHPLSDGETLISAKGAFALGFFTPPNTTNRYLGISYHNLAVHTVVWVANRKNPILNLNATLSMNPDDASLYLKTSGKSTPLWSSPSIPNSISNPIAQLLDTGNFVVKSGDSSSILWQSFDHPTDTLLPGMKLGPDLKSGVDRNLTAWLSLSDPSPGKYALAIDPIGVPQLVMRDAFGSWIWRGGPWNGFGFSGAGPDNFFDLGLRREFISNFNSSSVEIYYYFNTVGDAISIATMDQSGTARRYGWQAFSQKWDLDWLAPNDACDFFSACGINAVCDANSSPICRCLDGFDPKNPVSWSQGNWSDGCVRAVTLGCGANRTDEFMVVRASKLPDTTEAAADMSLDLDGCRTRCSMNCSCKAYANADLRNGGNGCIIWTAEIKDLRVYANGGQDLYVRVASRVKGDMATEEGGSGRRRRRRRTDEPPVDYGPAPPELHPSIAILRGRHRAAHPDLVTILEAASHLLMIREWPVNCPRFMDGLREVGLDCVSQLQYLRLDHHLLTALVERWSPQTNTFHLAVGEMTVTLQDVAMILGVRIDGPPVIGSTVVGEGRRWLSWPDCCDELIGRHPEPDVVYHDPLRPHVTSTFRMGQAHAGTCMPLRWLRWTFYRDSYLDMTDAEFWMHIRAYILFTIGSFLMPDTSGSEVHLQYLPLLEDLPMFSTFSIGAAVLAHLYRELHEATKPPRSNIAGCLHLLQVWSWEHLHVGRPTLQVPFPVGMEGLSVGCRWHEGYLREMTPSHVREYRDELDGLLQSQVIWEPYGPEIRSRVADICMAGSDIWLARVPLICWKRIEWYLPDRVLRQFGLSPRVDIDPIDPSFQRVDGRGKAGVDWVDYHRAFILQWEARHDAIVPMGEVPPTVDPAVSRYMRWYRSWASLYMLRAPTIPPTTYYPRAPGERLMREHILDTQDIFQPYFGRDLDTEFQHSINTYEELCRKLSREMHISDSRFRASDEASSSYAMPQSSYPLATGFHAGPSSMPDVGPHTYPYGTPAPYSYQEGMFSPFQSWQAAGSTMYPHAPVYMPHMYGVHPTVPYQPGHLQEIPDVTPLDEAEQTTDQAGDDVQHQQHHLRDRPRRPPAHYTPGSDALPPRRHRRH